jgi:transmembrane sensor
VLAASVGVLMVGLSMTWWWQSAGPGSWQNFRTAIGEQRIVELQDGSLAYLNTQSHLKVRFRRAARDVLLIDGEAMFKVQRDPARPFRVHAEESVIQAIGTQFNVYERTGDVTVSVIEGIVQVSPMGRRDDAQSRSVADASAPRVPANEATNAAGVARLVAGEQVLITATGGIEQQKHADIERVVAWRQRRLIFDADTLEDIALEFNRYNRTVQILIEDDAARRVRFTGVFDADDPESLAQLLERDTELELLRRGGALVVRSR